MRGTQSTDAFELFKAGVRARALPLTRERWEQSHKYFQEAIAVDTGDSFENAKTGRKGYARAWSWMAYGVALSYHEGWQGESAKAEAIDYAKISVEVDKFDYDNHWVAAFVHLLNGDTAKVEEHMNEALYLNEEDLNMSLLNEMADVLVYLGRTDDAIKLLDRARRITDWNHWSMAWSLYFKGKQDPIFYDRALEETRRTFWQPGEPEYEYDIQLLVGAIRVQKEAHFQSIGQSAQAAEERRKAQHAFDRFRSVDARKDWKLADELRRMPFAKTDAAKANLDHWVDGLKKLGLE
jgi:tetratricopeptide (TPR) repeat protein